MPSRPGRLGRVLRRVFTASVVLLLLPVPFLLAFRYVHPPATSVMVWQALARWKADVAPAWPTRTVVSAEGIAPSLRRAVLAAEDDRFYLHHGFDFTEIDRALDKYRAGGRLRGASTLSQQLAKNLFLWEGRAWSRKAIEAWITLWLELLVPKDRILDLYLNMAEWGDGIFGAEAAAQHHFGKSAKALTRQESARLAAILPAPRRWSAKGTEATRRSAGILRRMSTPAVRPTAPVVSAR